MLKHHLSLPSFSVVNFIWDLKEGCRGFIRHWGLASWRFSDLEIVQAGLSHSEVLQLALLLLLTDVVEHVRCRLPSDSQVFLRVIIARLHYHMLLWMLELLLCCRDLRLTLFIS